MYKYLHYFIIICNVPLILPYDYQSEKYILNDIYPGLNKK